MPRIGLVDAMHFLECMTSALDHYIWRRYWQSSFAS